MSNKQLNISRIARGKIDKDIDKEFDNVIKQVEDELNNILAKRLDAYTSDKEDTAYTGIDNAQVGSVYAQLSDLNQLRVAYETLRASYDDLLVKLKSTGIII